MPGTHALLSASSAYRWMNCTPSARVESSYPEETSPYAEEGTKAHAIAEKCLNTFIETGDYGAIDSADMDMFQEVLPYLDRTADLYRELKAKDEGTVLLTEQRLDFSRWVPEGFGTGDCLIISSTDLYIRDLKFGKGVKVSAVGNPQIRLYALGAYALLSSIYDIQRVVMMIDQCRLEDGASEETLAITDLLAWGETVKRVAEVAYRGEGDRVMGDWCHFCKARVDCPKRAEAAYELALKDFDEVDPAAENFLQITPQQMSLILSKSEQIKKYLSDLEAYALKTLQEGGEIPGWKVVEGRSTRRYTDQDAVIERLAQAGYPEALITERKLLGITAMEKALGGKKKTEALIGDLIEKPPGAPKLAPVTDKREAVNQAALDFKNID